MTGMPFIFPDSGCLDFCITKENLLSFNVMLCTIIFTGMGFAGLYWPELLGCLLPWSAVSLVSVPGMEVMHGLVYFSIGLPTLFGLFAALYTFKQRCTVLLESEDIDLFPKEFDALLLLAQYLDWVISPEQIYEIVWKESMTECEYVVYNVICQLRRKLKNPDLIQTMIGRG